MKNITFSMLISIAFLSSLSSCKSGLTEDQKVFLDYAKLEDRYHNSNFYLNLDVYSDTIAAPEYFDAKFTIAELRERMKRSFKLVESNRVISPYYDGPTIQYPHQYTLRRQADSSYQVELSVFVPDKFSVINLTKKDIGKVIEKEEASFVLLDISGDGATVMITDKANRNDYDYTYDFSERKNLKKEKETSIKPDPSYEAGLFLAESLTDPNETDDFIKDSLLRINFSRVNISLKDEEGKTLLSEGRINNFRHYLWYRNNDMPYEELKNDYMTIKYNYKEADKDSMHLFHPIEIVNIRGRGKAGSVEILIRSNKGKVENINLGNQILQPAGARTSETIRYRPLEKMDSSVINHLLKINYSTLNDKNGRPSSYLIYGTLPEAYKNAGLTFSFDEVWLKSADDSLSLDMDEASDYFQLGSSGSSNNLTAVKINKPQMEIIKIKGNILISTSGLSDSSFDVKSLPAAIKMFNNGKSFSISTDELSLEYLKEIFGLKYGNSKQALVYEYGARDSANENNIIIHFNESPEKLILRYRKNEGLDYSKPFELLISKPAL